MYDYDSDDYDYGFHGLDHDDYDDMLLFHMHMMNEMNLDDPYAYDPVLDTSNDSQTHSDYFQWEETRMKDSHLLKFKAMVPGEGERDEFELNSVTGGDWGAIGKMEEKQRGGWLESKMVVGYQQTYNLANQLGSLVTAWRERMQQCQGDWSKVQIRTLIGARKVTQNEALGGLQGIDEEDPSFDSWWLRECLGAKETEFSVEDRMRYSVGRGMVVFGNIDSLDQLARNIYGVKNLVQKYLIGVLTSSLPVSLPYPVLLTMSKLVCSSGGGTRIGWASMERASQLVESRYVNRVYLAFLDIYNVIREIMFKHAAETSSPNFPSKFDFLRSTLAKNLALLEAFHQLTCDEEPQAENEHYKEMKELKFELEPSKFSEIVLQIAHRLVVSGDHIFIVHTAGEGPEAGLVLAVHHLLTGDVLKQFTAVPKSLLPGEKYTLCTGIFVLGDLVAISLSQGYPKISPSSRDEVFVVNWVEEKLVISLTVPHSPQLRAAVRFRKEYYDSDSDSETDHDFLYSSLDGDNDDMVTSSLEVYLTKKEDHLFLLHSEVVLPDGGYKEELANWGQHVRVWGQQDRVLKELKDVRVLALQAGLVIYEEAGGNHSRSDEEFIEFDNIDVVVKWLDLVTGKELKQDSFLGNGLNPRPVYSITRYSEGDTLVLQYRPGEKVISLYTVNVTGKVEMSQEVSFPAFLTKVGGYCDVLKMELLSENVISASYSLVSPTHVGMGMLPVYLTRCVIAKADTEQFLAEMLVPNTQGCHLRKSNEYHTLAPADTIVKEGNRLVILKELNVDNFWKVSVRQYEFQKPALEVIKWDEGVAEDMLQKVETAKKVAVELLANKNTVLDVLAKDGKRLTGSLLNWCGSFGFLKLDNYPSAPNVFIHISEIRKPRPFLTAGVRLEVSLVKDFVKNKVKAVAARVYYY